MWIFTGSSGCSLVQKLPEFTRGERSSRRGCFYLQQIVRLRIPDGMRSWAHRDAGMQDSARRRCRGWGNPNQMERAEDHCRNNIHSGLRKPHCCNEKVLHKRRRLSQSSYYNILARGHWTIENNLHWMLDVTLKEDASRNNAKIWCGCPGYFYLILKDVDLLFTKILVKILRKIS